VSGTLNDHVDAILAQLRATGLVVFPGPNGVAAGEQLVPEGTRPPYVAVHFARPPGQSEDLGEGTSRMVVRAYCHSVGATDISARAVAQRVADALLDAYLSVAGRSCFPVRHESSQSVPDDESTGRRVVDLVDVYRLESAPA